MEWGRLLAYITGTVDQELLLRNEYLAAENRILRGQLKGRLRLSEGERATLGEIGRRLGRKALGEVATAALPDTIGGGAKLCGLQIRWVAGASRRGQAANRQRPSVTGHEVEGHAPGPARARGGPPVRNVGGRAMPARSGRTGT